MRTHSLIACVAMVLVTSSIARGQTTWYVRPDGGSCAECTGTVDAPYPGAGTAQPCAWDHLFRALPPGGQPRMAGGDTLIVAPGSYMMGYGAPETGNCSSDYPWDCYMPPIPGGPDPAHPTRILGRGYNDGCGNPPELWGTERAYMIINLTDSNNVEIGCLEITDHSGCVEFHSGGLACERDNYPFGEWAASGIYAEDSSHVSLHDLNIHGLADTGVHAGRLADWTVEDVRIAGNGWCGWDGDMIVGSSSNAGTLTFRRWTVEWNGCGETYPGGEPDGCWGQTVGGYGDGVGTGATAGDWVIEDSSILHNTSDGLDLLYHTLGGSVTLTRVRAEGNAGNQIKVAGTATITNCVLVGNCAFFDGQSFTFNVDNCRAMGNTLELSYTGGDDVVIANSTFYGQGDGLVGAGASDGCECTGAERLTGVNNLFLGSDEFLSPGDISFLFYQEECPGLIFKGNYSLAYNVKNRDAPYVDPPYPSAHNLFQNPGLAGPFSGATYGMTLTPGSPAIDAGTSTGAPADDINGQPRDSLPDMGAYEYSDAAATATPTPSPALDLEVSPLTAGRGFTIDLSLYKEIRGPSDFYLVAETPFGMYTIDLVGKITAGVRALYKNVPRAAAPQKKRISVRAAVPSSLAGEDVRFYTGAVKTGRVPGVPLAEISMRSPHMLAFDREAATVRHRGR